MIRLTDSERRESERKTRAEELRMWERLYQRGSGCFGVGRRDPHVKAELERRRIKP